MDAAVMGKGKTDLVIKMQYKTSKLKTPIVLIPEDGECRIDHEFLVPAQVPLLGGRLVFKVYDDDLTGDELIGSIHFNVKDYIPDADGNPGRMNGKFDWKNIYGAPLDCHGNITDKMNENPEIASFWKGRVLMQVTAEETEKPLLLVQKLESCVVDSAPIHLRPRQNAS